MTLRYYQEGAIQAVRTHLQYKEGNPCVVMATGAGKTPTMLAMIDGFKAAYPPFRVVVLAHVKELLQQGFDKAQHWCPNAEEHHFGLNCAGLNRRDWDADITFASIQSVAKHADKLGSVDMIIVDEAHHIPQDGDGQYRSFITAMQQINPRVVVVGFTATPYRMDCGMVCGPDAILNEVCYDAGVRELIRGGFLSPLVTKGSQELPDLSKVTVRGDFVAKELGEIMADGNLVRNTVFDMMKKIDGRKKIIVFAAGVRHAEMIFEELRTEYDMAVSMVTGESLPEVRDWALAAFKSGTLRCLVNVQVLTEGFDAPDVDCVVLMRPTLSAGLYYQMVGRGLRTHESKDDCLVLDYGANVERHGPIDLISPVKTQARGNGKTGGGGWGKTCEQCDAVAPVASKECPECGALFPIKLVQQAAFDEIVTKEGAVVKEVNDMSCFRHVPRREGAVTPSMKVMYFNGFSEVHTDYVCLEHSLDSFARTKAEQWWHEHTGQLGSDAPRTIDHALAYVDYFRRVESLALTPDGKFKRVVGKILAEKPEEWPVPVLPEPEVYQTTVSAEVAVPWEDDDIPF